jgi:hypothetical protein
MEEPRPLTSVHEALTNAVHASRPLPGKPTSFRLEDDVKGQAMSICERHGTNLSEYLRQCCVALVSDYTDPQRG